MPQPPDWNKYLDAGVEFVAMTRAQARQRAKELVGQGKLAQDQAQGFVDDLVDVVRKEIQRQVKTLGIATKDDLARLEARLAKFSDAGSAMKSPTKKAAKASSKQSTKAASKKATKKTAKKPAKQSTKKASKKTSTKPRSRRAAPKAAAS